MPTVEDYFDDDTDLPLPSSSKSYIPSTGLKGALLEEIGDDDMDLDKIGEQGRGEYGANSRAPPPSTVDLSDNAKGKLAMRDEELRPTAPQPPHLNPNTPMGGFMGDMMKLQEVEEERLAKFRKELGNNVASDPSTYKNWNTVYPLYFDAKVSVKNGRRVPRKSALWWPQATHIARACSALQLRSVLEPEKTHPADWENPGRVKVQFEKDGKFLNPVVKNRTQLYTLLAQQMQNANPKLVPQEVVKKAAEEQPAKRAPKAAAKGKGGKGGKAAVPVKKPVRHATRPPQPPHPLPVLDERYPVHTPLAPTGVALSAVKRDLESEKENKKKGIGGPDEGGAKQPKMKRVVVRGGKR